MPRRIRALVPVLLVLAGLQTPAASGQAARVPVVEAPRQVTGDPNPLRLYDIPALAVDPGDPDTVVMAVGDARNGGCGLRVSRDGGLSWAATAPSLLRDPKDSCIQLARQAPAYERYLKPWIPGVGFDGAVPAIAAHRVALLSHLDLAHAEINRFDDGIRRAAEVRVGLRLAVIGKGGAGKTVLSSTIARLLARRGRNVLAVDLDTNPGLAVSLGMAPTEAGLPPEAVEERDGANYGWQLAGGVTPAEVVARFAAAGPDGVRFLSVGKISSLLKSEAKRSVPAVVQVLLGVGSPDWDVVADLEAGPTTPFERYHAFASDAAVVVGPAWRSAMTARRLLPMVADVRSFIVASQYRDEPDHAGLAPWARVPFDPALREAERRGLAPLDACPGSPAIRAISELVDRLLAQPLV